MPNDSSSSSDAKVRYRPRENQQEQDSGLGLRGPIGPTSIQDPRQLLGELVTLTRATQLASVSRQTISLWVRDGELVPVLDKAKIPGARGRPGRLFRKDDVVRVARAHGTLSVRELMN